jgi:hypothetical protein
LLAAQLAARGRSDPEPPALVGVENRSEHPGRVEARQAKPIDRPVQADQAALCMFPTMPWFSIGW